MDFITISWKHIDLAVNTLVRLLKHSGMKFDGIYGVPRGGLIPAVMLSHYLQLPLLLYPTKKTLVVDDISDTGLTLNSFKDRTIVTIAYTKWTSVKPTFSIYEKHKKDSWLIFPWEHYDSAQKTLKDYNIR